MTAAALLLFAGAAVLWPGDTVVARRFTWLAPARAPGPARGRHPAMLPVVTALGGASVAVLVGGVAGVVVAAVVTAAGWWALRRARSPRPRTPGVATRLRSAGVLDLLAACLRAGLPVPSALEAVSAVAPTRVAVALRSTAGLLALGAEPRQAWAPVRKVPGLDELAAAAIRTSRSGTAFAGAAADLAGRLREELGTEAEERAERAGVVLALPVGLCFLPAFFCLGVLPVVLGLAGRLGSLF
jgi:Flp pilus assembly protein TadB